jgi:hypothetical protein
MNSRRGQASVAGSIAVFLLQTSLSFLEKICHPKRSRGALLSACTTCASIQLIAPNEHQVFRLREGNRKSPFAPLKMTISKALDTG